MLSQHAFYSLFHSLHNIYISLLLLPVSERLTCFSVCPFLLSSSRVITLHPFLMQCSSFYCRHFFLFFLIPHLVFLCYVTHPLRYPHSQTFSSLGLLLLPISLQRYHRLSTTAIIQFRRFHQSPASFDCTLQFRPKQ